MTKSTAVDLAQLMTKTQNRTKIDVHKRPVAAAAPTRMPPTRAKFSLFLQLEIVRNDEEERFSRLAVHSARTMTLRTRPKQYRQSEGLGRWGRDPALTAVWE